MDTNDVESRFQRARALHMQGDLDAAVEAYRDVVAHDGEHFRALTNLGDCLDRIGRSADAETAFAQACAAAPDQARPRYNLARQHHLRGDLAAAEAGYRRALELDPHLTEAVLNLGRLLEESGRVDEAGDALQGAAELAPASVAAQMLLGHLRFGQERPLEALIAYWRAAELARDGETAFHVAKTLHVMRRSEEAIQWYRRAMELDPDSKAARESLARALDAAGRRDEAIASLREWLARMPDEPIAEHMLAALGGGGAPERASDGYVRATFDNFAGVFDRTLERLEYRAPQLVAEAVDRHFDRPDASLNVLDAGCGTGLCGPYLRPYAARLEGVDLSGAMLEQAQRRGCYDALVQAELGEHLQRQCGTFDLIACADTLCYFGRLDAVLLAAARALKPGGLFVFTLELCPDDSSGYRLLGHGRYAHSPKYVEQALRSAHFRDSEWATAPLRNEGGLQVQGMVVVGRAGALPVRGRGPD